MGMSMGSSSSDDAQEMSEMNTTPLIDVMLVLLIMLIITIPVQLHSTNLNMPVNATSNAPEKPPVVVKIVVAQNGAVIIDGEAMADRESLENKLRSISVMGNQPEIHLRPDAKAPYSVVATVLSSAQRLGVLKLGIVGNERFMEKR